MRATFASDEPLDPFGAFISRSVPSGAGEGPLAGVRLCVKDNIGVAGEPFTAGHALFDDRTAEQTAPAVQRLMEAGASFVGMTRTDSGGFGMTTPDVRNPRFPGRTVGGSSGGIAAAVASGLADLGIGTDTGGSIRIPAACTGLFGFKPSYRRVPLDGVWPMAPNFDHVGLVARELPLLQRAGEVLLQEASEELDRTQLSIAVDGRSFAYEDPAMRARFDNALKVLERAGHKLERCDLPDRYVLAQAFGTLVLAEAREAYADLSEAERSRLGVATQRAQTATLQEPEIEEHRRAAEAATLSFEACLRTFDVLLSPTLSVPPPPQGTHSIVAAGQKWPVLQIFMSGTCFCNLLGAPALALPIECGDTPFSLHLASRRGTDLELFRIGDLVHRALEGQFI